MSQRRRRSRNRRPLGGGRRRDAPYPTAAALVIAVLILDWHQIIIDYQAHVSGGNLNTALMSGTLAHELGHGVGLEDVNDPKRVMTGSNSTGSTYDHVTQAEAKAYDLGS